MEIILKGEKDGLFCIYLKKAISRLPDQLGGKKLIYADDINFVTEKPFVISEISKNKWPHKISKSIFKKQKQLH